MREAEIKLASGKRTGEVCRELGFLSRAIIAGARSTARHAGIAGQEAQRLGARERAAEEAGGRTSAG